MVFLGHLLLQLGQVSCHVNHFIQPRLANKVSSHDSCEYFLEALIEKLLSLLAYFKSSFLRRRHQESDGAIPIVFLFSVLVLRN